MASSSSFECRACCMGAVSGIYFRCRRLNSEFCFHFSQDAVEANERLVDLRFLNYQRRRETQAVVIIAGRDAEHAFIHQLSRRPARGVACRLLRLAVFHQLDAQIQTESVNESDGRMTLR